MTKKCLKCGKEFESQRSSAKFCNASCRVSYGRVSVTDEVVSVTKRVSVTKPDDKRDWLIECFREDGKSPTEIDKIMQSQDDYYNTQGHYFIPARMRDL